MADLLVIITIVTCFFTAVLIKPVIGQLQTGGYSPASLFVKSKYFFKKYAPFAVTCCAFAAVYPLGLLINGKVFFAVLASLFLTVLIIIAVCTYSVKEKVPFVFTRRATRLYAFSAFAAAAVTGGAVYLISNVNVFWAGLPVCLSGITALPVVFIASAVTYPFERLNNLRYVSRAKKKLTVNPYLIKIGITGSFGKTSVKNILKKMLEMKYNVLATEGNYNTPLGIAKTVNNLDAYTDVFIAEMGARHVGDIKKLVSIVQPKYGILTGITAQHLETFKTTENILYEKTLLVKSLPEDGCGIVNRRGFDSEIDLPVNCEFSGGENDNVHVKDVLLSNTGTSFTLVIGKEEYPAETRLLGEHNLDNIAAAAALAVKLNVPPEKIVTAVKKLSVTPHRLQLIKNGGVTIIDDTYNANPVGVREALRVLRQFEGRKIVVTPGMVELGDRQDIENKLFGEEISRIADLVLLIGDTCADKIKEGLSNMGFSEKRIIKYRSLADAERNFPMLFGVGDVVIFINDLPDKY